MGFFPIAGPEDIEPKPVGITYISENTDQPVTIECRFADRPIMECGEDKTAVALRGQWQGGDIDIDPHWIPVCAKHDEGWDVDIDNEGTALPEKYRLPRFPLA